MKIRIVAILFILIVAYVLIHVYIGWNGLVFLSIIFPVDIKIIYWICLGVVAFSYLIGRLGSRFMPEWCANFLKRIGSYWMGIMVYALILLPIADLAAWLLDKAGVEKAVYIPWLGLLICAMLAAIMVRGSWNARNPIVRKYQIKIAKPAGPYPSLRIAVASDLHLGTIVGDKQLAKLVEQINRLDCDLVLLPGDIIDDDINPFIKLHMSEQLKQLHSPLGVFAVLGNHEYYSGHILQLAQELERIGIQLLMDQTVKVADCLYIVGRKDHTAERMDPQGRLALRELLKDIDTGLPIIMMDHQPHKLDQAAENGIDLMLSGHTHRAQMAPLNWFTKRLFELDWGYKQRGNMHAIVSSGFGTWGPPIRIGSRCEVIEITAEFTAAP